MIKRNGDNVFAIASSNQCQGARGTVSFCPSGIGGAATRIPRATATAAAASTSAVRMTPPDAHHNTKEANIALSTYVEKWKNRYEEAERKHKAYLLKSEKAKREYDDLNRRYNILQEERNHLDGELRERERELGRLRTVSEKLFREYQQLKNQQEVDEGVMHKVMAQAGEWYKQNKQLKRQSSVLLQALPAKGLTDIDFTDSNDTASDTSSNEEVEFLKQTVSELSRQVAALQTELSQAKLHEFEAHEANVALTQDLESCQASCSSQESELSELRSQLERHNRVSKLLVEEVTALKDTADKDREMCETYKTEARAAKKRVKVLTHQSLLLSGEMDAEERLALLLRELDELRAALEDQGQRHRDQLDDLQLKLAEKHEDTDILVWEEKIKLAEEDARRALERAERAERRLGETERTLSDVGTRLTDSERKLCEVGTKLTATETKLTDTSSRLSVTENKLSVSESRLTATVKPKRSNLMSRISYFENGASPIDDKRDLKKEIVEEVELVISAPAPDPPSNIAPPLETTITTPIPASPISPPPAAAFNPPPPAAPIAPPPPPPFMPPPPPPPPPPPAVFNIEGDDMASMLANKQGTLRRSRQNLDNGAGGAIDAIVDQIKGGKFHLKSRESNFLEKKPKDEQPEAVKEMLAILGTLRKRRPTLNTRPEVDYTDF